MRKRIDTTIHYAQYIFARIFIVGLFGLFIHSLMIKNINALIFYSIFLIYGIFLLIKVFDKPNEITFDENYLYLEDGTRKIGFKDILSVKKNWIYYKSSGIEFKLKLPNFHSMDKNWNELKELMNQ